MRHIILSIALLFVITTQGLAQNPTKKEKIKTLFALLHQDSLVIKTIEGMTSSMVKNMARMLSDTSYTKMGADVSSARVRGTRNIRFLQNESTFKI